MNYSLHCLGRTELGQTATAATSLPLILSFSLLPVAICWGSQGSKHRKPTGSHPPYYHFRPKMVPNRKTDGRRFGSEVRRRRNSVFLLPQLRQADCHLESMSTSKTTPATTVHEERKIPGWLGPQLTGLLGIGGNFRTLGHTG